MALRTGELAPPVLFDLLPVFLLLPLLCLPVFHVLGVYRTVVRFMGMQVARAILLAAAVATGLLAVVVWWTGVTGLPGTLYILFGLLLAGLMSGTRMVARVALPRPGLRLAACRAVVIYGAGTAGIQLASMLEHGQEYRAIAFVDDDPAKVRTEVRGLRVYRPAKLSKLVERYGVTDVLLALPSASRRRRQEIIESLESLPVHVRTIPALQDVISGASKLDELKEVEIEDLLGRDAVPPDLELLDRCIANRSVLVTGAGGSIGGELCRQILARGPSRLVLFEQSELALYSVERSLRALAAGRGVDVELVPILGSVLDQARLERVMRSCRVDTVYHAAAYKHVPIVEANAAEGVTNNVFGTLAAVRASIEAGVRSFVLISTDKAVNPTNVMGASKRVAELVLQGLAGEGGATCLSMVRFGNVLGSSGSVVPLFREQIRVGGPVTVTDPRIIRYFMTIPEAAQLVLQAGALGTGGDVFVLDMGEPVRIVDMARRMIRLSGLTVRDEANPDGDIEIVFTGLRPGEKLYEELLIGGDVSPSGHPMIMRARERCLDWPVLEKRLRILESMCRSGDEAGIRHQLATLVDGYTGGLDVSVLPSSDVRG
ncbi:MAG: nucleoside-diphosphate sugar epimerase/dehydratase [Pseudomonadales bacterium]|nr:nucleoside-diphosphate sugar epimerase/dehydratase [Pseudomonadales bacterium]